MPHAAFKNPYVMKNNSLPHALLVLLLVVFAAVADAATHTWTGNGPNALWSTSSNWENNSPPFANESPVGLIFPATANRRISTNNVSGLQVSALLMDGATYTLRGTGAGTNITLLPGGFFGTVVASGGLGHTLDSSLNFTLTGTNVFTIGTGASLGVAARLVGTGSLRKGGEGSLRLRTVTSNTYSGATEIALGDLELHSVGIAVPGALFIGQTNSPSPASVRLLASEQIADAAPVTVHTNGIFLLNAFSETIGDLTLIGGKVDTGSGVLSPASITGVQAGAGFVPGNAGDISGAVQLRAPATNRLTVLGDGGSRMELRAQLRGGSGNALAALEKHGLGHAYLYASNSFNGPTILREGIFSPVHTSALGSTNSGTVVQSNAILSLNNVSVFGESLTLDAMADLHSAKECFWGGSITLAGDAAIYVQDNAQAGKTLTLYGKISGPGGLKKIGPGVLVLNGTTANTFAGLTRVEDGELHLGNAPGFNVTAIPGRLRVGSSATPTIKSVKLIAPGQLSTNCVLEVIRRGVLDLQDFSAGVAGLTVNDGGRVNGLAAGLLTLNGPLTSTNSVSGSTIAAPLKLGPAATNVWVEATPLIIEGALTSGGSLLWEKLGSGQLTLAGDGTYPGRVRILGGAVWVDGHLPMTSFDLLPSRHLYGTGQVAQVRFQGGWLSPTVAAHPFRVQELVATNLGLIELNILSAANYSRLASATQPKLDGKFALYFFLAGGYSPPIGQNFTLLRNDSALPISGTLKDLPEGVLVPTTGNQYFRVTYQGGDGNDLVVTKVLPPIPATLQFPVRLADGQMQLSATGTPGAWYEIQASENSSSPAAWHTVGYTIAKPDGTLSFKDTTAGSHPMRFYRFSDTQP